MKASQAAALGASLAALAIAVSCGGSEPSGPKAPEKRGVAVSAYDGGADDRTLCRADRPDRESLETRGPGALIPNVRRVYAVVGDGDERRRQILCREVDSNLDGMKDVVRTYDDKGSPLREQADSDFDGRVDTWITFAAGRLAKVELDKNGDGQPDEFKFYTAGDLVRVQRDTNHDGKADVWEIYSSGALERMGVDLDFDGHVDRWDRDEIARRRAEQAEQEELEREEKEKEARRQAAQADAGAQGDGG